jgi:hypothetical protein
MWGDFGGIKPQAALEFECFRSQALGGGNGVGDQLHPRGTLDTAAYRLIGAVYEQCEAAEPFYCGSQPIPQVGIFAADDLSLEGAVQMCEESHYEAAILNDESSLNGFELLILPDSTVITEQLQPKLHQFLAGGGRVIASYRGGFNSNGKWPLASEIPLSFDGEIDRYPSYWRARTEFAPQLAGSDRVVYEPGMRVQARGEARVLVDRVLPYFKRTDLTFCSHFQAPPVPEIDAEHPAVLGGSNWIYFADPICREYRKSGNTAVRDGWRSAVEQLIGPAPFGRGLPTTMLIYPRRCGDDLRLTLLHYVPLRKSLDIDIVEERMSFAGETLYLPKPAREVRIFNTSERLPRDGDGGFILPVAKGRLLLEVPGFFTSRAA